MRPWAAIAVAVLVACHGEEGAAPRLSADTLPVDSPAPSPNVPSATSPGIPPPSSDLPPPIAPVAEPPASEAPAAEPPVEEPPASEPPAAEPPVEEPAAPQPPAVEPPVEEPPAPEPPAAEPPVEEPPPIVPPVISPERPRIPVLLYHHVLPEAERQSGPYANSVAVALEQFQEQMAFLKVNGYRTIGADELSAIATGSHVPDGKPVIITFDDGLKSTYVNAYPVLKDHGFEAMVFVITSRVTEERMPYDPATLQFLSWDEIAEMRDVFSIGAHTHALHYRNADGISALLTFREDGVRADLARNRALLFDTRFFAYPFGQVDERAASLVAEAGFSVAFIVEGRSYDWQTNDALHIPRLSVSSSHTLNDFAELLETPP